ncbi:site-specific integrase [Vibrio sp. Isolate24]|uniref:tyrosine-type recombinase/integrase n=1 Tax=Vibrio sp. Isolate24 TaxID=2908534 RepID=UPI001EFE7FA8|nr:site-specific integrase [Vibrio sp. Isolate24]MCG9678762.1 site-specific integrase [Vibrio sp. Isolate24]
MGIRLNSNALVAQTVKCKISDAKIRQYAKVPGVRQLKDERYSLYFIYKKDRTKGSWRLMSYKNGKQASEVFASYPQTPALKATKLVKLNRETGAALVEHDYFPSLNHLLEWHIKRQERLSKLSKNRIVAMKSMFDSHLCRCFEGLGVENITHSEIDERLIVPMLSDNFSLSYVRSMFQFVKVAVSTAYEVKKLSTNPMGDMKWTNFIKQPIKPKPPKLLPLNALAALEQIGGAEPMAHALCIMMLYHGTRIGETRLAKWCHINLEAKQWHIPARNTKSKKDIVYPLSDEMVEFLASYKQWQLSQYYKGNNVFPLTKRDKSPIHASLASKMVRDVSKGLWSAHDLRKLARTIWADLGIDYLVAESLLNHAKDKLDIVYIHSKVELQKKDALNTYHHWLKNCWRTCQAPTFLSSIFQ